MIITISAKCSDMFFMGDTTGREYDGYVPACFPEGGDDYVCLEIDTKTGKIVNWPKNMTSKLNKLLK